MKKFSIMIAGRHATSVSLEEEFYCALINIVRERQTTLNQLVTEIDKERTTPNLSSALRLYVLKTLQEKLSQV
ncbi:MAG: ribbon-helix-helix domain-containing protein [Acetobacter sp.]|nr:ribbon-helix-helix domain-containing protein [Acetobacter sp.]